MKRLFTYGCSFTGYVWPTWADILGRDYEVFENYGRTGAGNQYIFNALVETHLRRQLTDKDTVAIMWTNVSREDRYVDREWITPGNIYSQDRYPAEFVKDFADTRGFYIRDLAIMYATESILKSIGCKYYFFSMVDISNSLQYDHQDDSDDIDDILPYYGDLLTTIKPSVHRTVFGYDWWSRPRVRYPWADQHDLSTVEKNYKSVAGPDWPSFKQYLNKDFTKIDPIIVAEVTDTKWQWEQKIARVTGEDPHPTPLEHLEYLDAVAPDLKISDETRLWTFDIEQQVRAGDTLSWSPMQIKRW